MANNRMSLVNKKTGARIFLAKYYPSLGWFTNDKKLFETLNEGFHKSDWSHLTPAQKKIKAAQPGFGRPYANYDAEHLDKGDEWELEYEVRSEPSTKLTHGT